MTRKDYIAIAAAIKGIKDGYGPNWNANLFRALNDVSNAIASHMAHDNSRFDRDRFLKACGVQS